MERVEPLPHWTAPAAEKYATVFYCLLDLDGRLKLRERGALPPMVVRAGGELSTLEATGMPVGLMEAAEFRVAERRLAPCDKVVIYTDGVTEAQNAPANFSARSACGRL